MSEEVLKHTEQRGNRRTGDGVAIADPDRRRKSVDASQTVDAYYARDSASLIELS